MIPFEHFLLVFNRLVNSQTMQIDHVQLLLTVKYFIVSIYFFINYPIIGSGTTHRTNSPTALSGHHTSTNSMDGDEYCRITIDSITKSYKIDSPSKPLSLMNKKVRATSHSLLSTQYTEGT